MTQNLWSERPPETVCGTKRCLRRCRAGLRIPFLAALMLFLCLTIRPEVMGQAPYPAPGPPAMQPAQPPFPQQPRPPQPMPQTMNPQQPLEYAFRPDLTNPQFGECLQIEKNWKAVWQQYYYTYEQIRMMSPQDPRLQQMLSHAHQLKRQHDAAWQALCDRCIYFPQQ